MSTQLVDDRFGETLDRFAVSLDIARRQIHAHPWHRHHLRDADVLSALVQIGCRRFEQRQQDVEGLVLTSVLTAQGGQFVRISAGR